jgi:adenine/guanine phosphoribosyltransferase-like PRPP-binding protein
MAFFKKYNGTTNVRLLRMERWIWILIYGGLLSIVLSTFVDRIQGPGASAFLLGGALAVVAGVVMVVLRSKLREE